MIVPARDWTDINWTGVDARAAAHWIAVLPLAATEQHGPHLPLSTDTDIATAIARELAQSRFPSASFRSRRSGFPPSISIFRARRRSRPKRR